MKVLYGIEPDLCIINPEILVDFTKDIILPKYFYAQITHLSQGNFQAVTDAAIKILNSLIKQEQSDVLIFNTVKRGIVYFTDEATNHKNIDDHYKNLDTRNLLDRYLLSLFKFSEIIAANIVFLASSSEVIRKCRNLNFEVATLEEFTRSGESWLRPKMLVDIQASIDDKISEPKSLVTQEPITAPSSENPAQIQWQDIRLAGEPSNIHWINITFR
jgi:hypothetical protein